MSVILLRSSLTILLAVAGWAVFRQAWALETFRQGPTLEGLEEALRWDPRSGDYHFHTGLIHRDSVEHRDLDRAIAHLERALQMNPYNWRFWFELGHTRELKGEIPDAEAAYRRALELNPLSPVYQWRTANFLVRIGRIEESLPHFTAAVSRDGDYAVPSLMLLSRLGVAADRLSEIWPTAPQLRLELFRFMTRPDVPEGFVSAELLHRQWRKLLDDDPPPAFRDGRFYLTLLFEQRRYAEARQRWVELAARNGHHDPEFAEGRNLIWQGGFEGALLGHPLGWSVDNWNNDAYSTRIEEVTGRNSSRAVRFDFKGTENLSLRELRQHVTLEAGRRYRFSFESRSEGLTTEQGPYFEIVDLEAGRSLIRSQRILGTTPWTRYEEIVEAGPDTYRVLVRLRRDPSRRIDNSLGGTLWVTSVRLEPTGPSGDR